MKALSLKQPWASLIMIGLKTIETRKWETGYRGDIIICSSLSDDKDMWNKLGGEIPGPYPYILRGYALGIVELYDIVRMTREYEIKACCQVYPGAYAWLLRNIRRFLNPHHIKGKVSLFELDIKDNDFINII
jgi:hypothetical protein